MDRHMDRFGKMNSMTPSPFFRADHRRAVDGVIAYFGDSLASASPPATLTFRGAAGDKTPQPLMPWLGNEVMGCRMAPCLRTFRFDALRPRVRRPSRVVLPVTKR